MGGDATSSNDAEWVRIGVLTKPVGVHGELVIHLAHDDGEVLTEGLLVRLAPPRGSTVEARVTRVFADGTKLAIEGVTTRDAAERLKGAVVSARRADFPDVDDDELYLVDLIGMRVVSARGEALGHIEAFSDNGAQPLAIVVDGGRTVEMPFVDGIVVRVDESARIVVVDPPEGLFFGEALVDERADGENDDA